MSMEHMQSAPESSPSGKKKEFIDQALYAQLRRIAALQSMRFPSFPKNAVDDVVQNVLLDIHRWPTKDWDESLLNLEIRQKIIQYCRSLREGPTRKSLVARKTVLPVFEKYIEQSGDAEAALAATAKQLGLSEDATQKSIALARSPRKRVSLPEDEEGSNTFEKISHPDSSESIENKILARRVAAEVLEEWENVHPQWARIFRGVYLEDKSASELAEELGISRIRVYQLLEKINERLQKFQ